MLNVISKAWLHSSGFEMYLFRELSHKTKCYAVLENEWASFSVFFLFAHDFLAAAVTENTENAAENKHRIEEWRHEGSAKNGSLSNGKKRRQMFEVLQKESLRWCSVMCLQPFHHFHFAMFSSHALILVPFVLHVDMIISPVHTHNIIQAHANNIIKIFLKRYCSNNNLVCALAHVCQSLFLSRWRAALFDCFVPIYECFVVFGILM